MPKSCDEKKYERWGPDDPALFSICHTVRAKILHLVQNAKSQTTPWNSRRCHCTEVAVITTSPTPMGICFSLSFYKFHSHGVLKCFHVIFTFCLFVWWNKPLLGFMITICDKKIIMISVWTLHVTDQLLLPASTFVRIGISRFLRRVWARRLLVFLHNMSFRRRDYCKSRVLQIRRGGGGRGGVGVRI